MAFFPEISFRNMTARRRWRNGSGRVSGSLSSLSRASHPAVLWSRGRIGGIIGATSSASTLCCMCLDGR
jgi:hypothetical protein